MKIYTFLVSLDFSILCIIIISRRSCGADYQYESCVPTNCGNGPNISFPFYNPTLHQESYCGFPGFVLTCRDGFPVLQLSENDYVVEDIFYRNSSLHVYNAAVTTSDNGSSSNCIPRIRNTIIPRAQFGYAGSTKALHLFSNCTEPLPEELLRHNVSCESSEDVRNWTLAVYDEDVIDARNAMERCTENVVLPVEEGYGDEDNDGIMMNLREVLRKGFMMNWTASDCNTCEDSGGRCGFNASTYHFRCFCPDRPHSRSCPPRKRKFNKILLIGGVTLAALAATSIISFLLIRKKFKLLILPRLQTAKPSNEKVDIELFLKNNGNLAPRRFRYLELKKITKSFKEKLGEGGYGSVYKGKLPDGRHVAVKILNESKGNNGEEFMNEVASISRTSHINVVTLLGFCFEGSKRALIYEFMPNGSLEKYIHNDGDGSSSVKTIEGKKLFDIVIGIARGLEYLHQGCNTRILHFDIKPHNILLDNDFNPKISDFGLARLCPNRSSIVSMMGMRGTIGYIAPEVFSRNFGGVSHKSDVYSYGMMVLEIAGGGRKSIDRMDADHTSEIYFPQYLYRELTEMDCGDLDGIVNEDGGQLLGYKRKLIIVGLWCIQTDPKDRPSMSKVVEMLEGKVESLQIPPKLYLSSPPRPQPSFSTSQSM